MADLKTFAIRSVATIRDSYLRVISNGLKQLGVTNPNVGPGSDYYLAAIGIANECAVAEANAVISADATMPDTATGDALVRWMAAYGLSKRPAGGSIGQVTITCTSPSPVITGAQMQDAVGLRYQVATGGTYASGAVIPVTSVDTGRGTNHTNGDVLTWVSAPPYASQTVTVGQVGGTDGLTGGVDIEDEETASARLLARLAGTPAAGNAQHCAELAEAASPAVQKAYVYPAAQGPSTVHIAVAGYATAHIDPPVASPSVSRVVNATTVSSIVGPYVVGQLPEYVLTVTTGTVDVPTDVSFALSLPSAPSASPPGPGGGWLDGAPWPANSAASSTFRCSVTAVANSTSFTVDAPTAPVAGSSRICWLSPIDWRVYSATVTAVSGTSGAYVITLDQPFVGIATGNFISPQCVNQRAYFLAILKAFSLMGPGEKTANATILQRAARRPTPQQQWPYSLGASMLRALSDVGTEVLAEDFLYRSTVTPAVPGAITSAPGVLIPRNLGLYPAT